MQYAIEIGRNCNYQVSQGSVESRNTFKVRWKIFMMYMRFCFFLTHSVYIVQICEFAWSVRVGLIFAECVVSRCVDVVVRMQYDLDGSGSGGPCAAHPIKLDD